MTAGADDTRAASTRANYERVVSAMQPFVSARSDAWAALDALAARLEACEQEREEAEERGYDRGYERGYDAALNHPPGAVPVTGEREQLEKVWGPERMRHDPEPSP